MRTVATIFLMILLISGHTPLGQLLKAPVLIEHFHKHKKRDGVSLWNFLNDHYAIEHDDADKSEDEKLPFKAIQFQSIEFAAIQVIVNTALIFGFGVSTKETLQDFYIPQQHLCRIFHPPRVLKIN